ncbi:hypothetical protein DL89DRAFT_264328 [Linderina pennispora]|uniref:HMG box domain-containing protein n=1 Tax=Linderina pennispora TaxID=61395 RepID=A0A1Y1WLM3_9FUNG|nr:uncharacterized protein DL89DRAFT_264328 [Linderina pennispora]ORX74469.1 hypothetical protein DL89DRAFT_264328 [Linderina pennispora]
MSSHQYTQMVPVEFPQSEQDFRRNPPPHQAGATYKRQIYMVRSDKLVITIPASTPIPPNSGVLAVDIYPANRESDLHYAPASSRHPGMTSPIEQNQVRSWMARCSVSGPRTRQVDNYHGQQQQQQQQQTQMDDETHDDDTYAHDGDDLPVVTIMDETGAASTSMTAASPYLMHASTVIEDDVPKPKKPRNSFFYFRRSYHKSTNASGNRMRAKNISGAAGKIWKDMSEEDKAQYKELAAEDTKRYKQEMRLLGHPLDMGTLPRSPLIGSRLGGPASGSRFHAVTVVPAIQSLRKRRRSSIAEQPSPYVSEGKSLPSSSPPMTSQSNTAPSSRQPLVFSFNGEGMGSGIDTITFPPQSPPRQMLQQQQQQQQPAQWSNLNELLAGMGPPVSHPSVLDSSAFMAALGDPDGGSSSSQHPATEHHLGVGTSAPPTPAIRTRDRSSASSQAQRHTGTVVNSMISIHPSIPDIEVIDASNSISLRKYSVKQRK